MRSLTLASAAAVSVLLAACGSSSSSSSSDPGNLGASANYQKSLQFAQCMRTHGVTDFPDPKSNGRGGMLIQSSNGQTKVNGTAINAPAFQAAMQACRAYLPNGGHPQPLSAARRQQALAWAACMRSHGLTNFPDPTFNGGGIALHGGPGGIDPNSPVFKSAQAACGSPLGKGGP
jgi:hypothetical protein